MGKTLIWLAGLLGIGLSIAGAYYVWFLNTASIGVKVMGSFIVLFVLIFGLRLVMKPRAGELKRSIKDFIDSIFGV